MRDPEAAKRRELQHREDRRRELQHRRDGLPHH
jgi:hypothetical protein